MVMNEICFLISNPAEHFTWWQLQHCLVQLLLVQHPADAPQESLPAPCGAQQAPIRGVEAQLLARLAGASLQPDNALQRNNDRLAAATLLTTPSDASSAEL